MTEPEGPPLTRRPLLRRAIAGAIAAVLVAVFAPRVGERANPEAPAIGAIRAILSGQSAFAAKNGSHYTTLDGLAGGYLDPQLAATKERRGYRFIFQAGPEVPRAPGAGRIQPAMTRFAVVAIPAGRDAAGHRTFCADDTGAIYVTAGGGVPRVAAGRCLDTSRPLR